MAEFGLIRPFGIDNGELDGLRPNECFVLGYECALIDERIKTGVEFSVTIHAENHDRIAAELDKKNRDYDITWMEGDVSEAWMTLNVRGA